MYATQPLLPQLRVEFGAGEAAVGATVSALTFSCALAAPFVGPIADRVGRKRVIVGGIIALALVTFASATATTLASLIAWRFVQGLFMPGIFAVTLAYIAEEIPAGVGGSAVGAYIAGNVMGGFLGRYITALVASRWSWQVAFVVLGTLNLAGAIFVWIALPRATHFERATSFAETFAAFGRFMRNRELLATYAVGGLVLFSLVASFTFATFHLAAPPFRLGTLALGSVFFVYLFGVVATPIGGRLIDRFGNRVAVIAGIGISICGMMISLIPSVVTVVAGLAFLSTGVFIAQAGSQGYIGQLVSAHRSTAAALYLTVYYAGGGLGAILPAAAWTAGGWPLTVALIVAVQCAGLALVVFAWRHPPRPVAVS